MLCGVAPLPASSGKTHRHRLNARAATDKQTALLYRIESSTGFAGYNSRTRTYRDRRIQEGLSTTEAMRCLKRYIAREIYTLLTA